MVLVRLSRRSDVYIAKYGRHKSVVLNILYFFLKKKQNYRLFPALFSASLGMLTTQCGIIIFPKTLRSENQ